VVEVVVLFKLEELVVMVAEELALPIMDLQLLEQLIEEAAAAAVVTIQELQAALV
jgi:hypothetical protein